MKHILKTPPTLYPVSLAEMRTHLGITRPEDSARDAIITGRIASATQWCEQYTRSAFVTQTWTGYADCFPNEIKLRGPLLAVQEIRYIDTSGVDQVLAANQYVSPGLTAGSGLKHSIAWETSTDVLYLPA